MSAMFGMDDQQRARQMYHRLAAEETQLFRRSSALLQEVGRLQQATIRPRHNVPLNQSEYMLLHKQIQVLIEEHQSLRPLLDVVQAQIKRILPLTFYTPDAVVNVVPGTHTHQLDHGTTIARSAHGDHSSPA